MLASGSDRPCSDLGGPETRQLTLGAGRLFGRTAEDGQAGQGNAVQPGGDLVVHKQVRGPKAPASNQAAAASSISMKPQIPLRASRENCETSAIRRKWQQRKTRHLAANPLYKNGDTRPCGPPTPSRVRNFPERRTGKALRLTAEYINGALKPLEPVDLKEGTVVTLYIEEQDQNKRQVHSPLETADRIRESAPADKWDNLPTDGARNYRHYLYGHPKEEE